MENIDLGESPRDFNVSAIKGNQMPVASREQREKISMLYHTQRTKLSFKNVHTKTYVHILDQESPLLMIQM